MTPRTTKQNEDQADDQGRDIAKLKTDVALIRQDLRYQSKAMNQLDAKMDRIGTTVENLKYVPFETYQAHLQTRKEQDVIFDARLRKLEDYQEANDPGVKFINKIFSKLVTLLVLAATTGVLGALAYNVLQGAK